MNCVVCGVSAFKKPLSRTNPICQENAGFMCQESIKIKEPELYKNLKDSGDFKITNEIICAINQVKNNKELNEQKR